MTAMMKKGQKQTKMDADSYLPHGHSTFLNDMKRITTIAVSKQSTLLLNPKIGLDISPWSNIPTNYSGKLWGQSNIISLNSRIKVMEEKNSDQPCSWPYVFATMILQWMARSEVQPTDCKTNGSSIEGFITITTKHNSHSSTIVRFAPI